MASQNSEENEDSEGQIHLENGYMEGQSWLGKMILQHQAHKLQNPDTGSDKK